ncbi:Y-family DNA polymerase [Staphylococcus pseudoxylosus]|uniref:Y-family DNA polymerase n=1 Tax=Staphylococcus pseudoxylosus TaxID=2282419 RepID=UPI001F3A4C47|nr:Y-family DNA polymerase [Staphylococcus pseudoxylosus]MCE5003452.1 Y-family DNA polymerase [Staphylococcus pseudoxylosus]
MYDYYQCQNRDIICVDLKSFYASVSCILNGLDPLTTKLAVVGDTKRQGSVVLAATPPLKQLGIKTGSRLYEIPKRSDIYITNPKMRTYMNLSTKISKIALNYVAAEDFHQYSIDEFFLDLTSSRHLFSNSTVEVANLIQKEIYDITGINSTIGIGSNMLLAKVSMDIEAKHTPSGIAEWRYEDVPNKLWKINNLTDMWGINVKTAKKLNKRGIFTVGDLAKYPHVYLKRDFGIIGTDLHLHANGIDESIVSQKHKTNKQGLGKSKILLRDYKLDEVKPVLIEHVEDTFYRTRLQNKYPTTISISLGYADGGGIRKQFTEKNGFKTTNEIINRLWAHVVKASDSYELYRTIGISFTNFKSSQIMQLELFKTEKETKNEIIDHALDSLRLKYGQNIVMRATSLLHNGSLSQPDLLAGHKA